MIEALNWVFQDIVHFLGVCILFGGLVNGLTRIIKATKSSNKCCGHCKPSKIEDATI